MTLQDQQPEIIHNFRRCHMRGCLGMGYWQPVISISPDGIQRAYMPFPHWLMCDHHKEAIGIEDLVDKPISDGRGAWESIQAAFARVGKDTPEREYTQLIWRPA